MGAPEGRALCGGGCGLYDGGFGGEEWAWETGSAGTITRKLLVNSDFGDDDDFDLGDDHDGTTSTVSDA